MEKQSDRQTGKTDLIRFALGFDPEYKTREEAIAALQRKAKFYERELCTDRRPKSVFGNLQCDELKGVMSFENTFVYYQFSVVEL